MTENFILKLLVNLSLDLVREHSLFNKEKDCPKFPSNPYCLRYVLYLEIEIVHAVLILLYFYFVENIAYSSPP